MGMGGVSLLAVVWVALTAAVDEPLESAGAYVARGMERFKENKIAESIADFDRAAELAPLQVPRLWQRGISYYYAEQFQEGREQFETHKAVNPHDVENATWHFICVARLEGVEGARQALIEIDTERDARVPMAEVYELYAGRGSEEKVLAAAEAADTESARMYAHLYLGLYYEVAGKVEKSRAHLRKSAAALLNRQHYMHDVARIHLLQRGWEQ